MSRLSRSAQNIPQVLRSTFVKRLMTTGALRFALLTLLSALVSAAAGGALIYLSVLAWQSGEMHAKGGIIRASTSPIQFYLATGGGSLLGLFLILGAPWLCIKAFASADERARLTQLNPKIYSPVRPSLRIGILLVATTLLVAWIVR